MQSVTFTYTVPIEDEQIAEFYLHTNEDLIRYAREQLEELIAQEGVQAPGEITTQINRGEQKTIPVETSMAALQRMTLAQLERLITFCNSYSPSRITLYADDWKTDNLLFRISDPPAFELQGLLEPDGRAHT